MELIERKNIEHISFARACCALGIIIYHFFCHSNSSIKFLYETANISWGGLFVTVFFSISGAVLYYNYKSIQSLIYFYFKRWKAIFPAFYFCWSIFYIERAIIHRTLFWGGNPLKLLLTLFGVDGYFGYYGSNYYTVGEWFLGSIIILYALYPIIVFLFNKSILLIAGFLVLGYIGIYTTNFFKVPSFRNIIVCLGSFYFGMLSIKYNRLFFKNYILGFCTLIVFVFLCLIKVPIVFIGQLQGFLLYIILNQFGIFVMQSRLNNIFNLISANSFYIFLFQHMIIVHILYIINPISLYFVIPLLLLVIVITCIISVFYGIFIKYFLRLKLFNRNKVLDLKS